MPCYTFLLWPHVIRAADICAPNCPGQATWHEPTSTGSRSTEAHPSLAALRARPHSVTHVVPAFPRRALPPLFHGPPTPRTVRVLACEAEVLIAAILGLRGSLRVQQDLGSHTARSALGILACKAACAALGCALVPVRDLLLRGHVEGGQRQEVEADAASLCLTLPTCWELRRLAVEAHGFMESLILLQDFQRPCVILGRLALLAASATSYALHFPVL